MVNYRSRLPLPLAVISASGEGTQERPYLLRNVIGATSEILKGSTHSKYLLILRSRRQYSSYESTQFRLPNLKFTVAVL